MPLMKRISTWAKYTAFVPLITCLNNSENVLPIALSQIQKIQDMTKEYLWSLGLEYTKKL